MTTLYEAMEAVKQYYLKKVQDIIYEQNRIKKEEGESSVSEVDHGDYGMIFVIQKMINNKKIPLGYTDSWQKAEEMFKKLEQCKHDPKYGSISYSIFPLRELPDKIPKEWK